MAKKTELLPVRAGVAVGILWALSLVSIGISNRYDYATAWFDLMASAYIGFSSSAKGILLGVIYGFIDGFVAGFLVVWLYNKLNINK